jgi:hypothetical protein
MYSILVYTTSGVNGLRERERERERGERRETDRQTDRQTERESGATVPGGGVQCGTK